MYRSPYRIPYSRGSGVPAVEKYAEDNLAVELSETATATPKIPVKKSASDTLGVYMLEGILPVRIRDPQPLFFVFGDTLERVCALPYSLIIQPRVEQDYNTGQDTLTFDYPLDEREAQSLEADNTLLIEDEDGDLTPYNIREAVVISSGDQQIKRVHCDHLYYELRDGPVRSYDLTNNTPMGAIASALEGTRWEIGAVAEPLQTVLADFDEMFSNPLEFLRRIETAYSARLKFRVEVDTKGISGYKVDLEQIDNEFKGQRFEFGWNLQDIEISVDHTEIKTALLGYAQSSEIDPGTEEPLPLTFEEVEWTSPGDPVDKPIGQDWVGDENARELYGIYDPGSGEKLHRYGKYESRAVTSTRLLAETWNQVTQVNEPRVHITATVADLEKVRIFNTFTGELQDLNHEKIRLGNICYVIARHEGLLAAVESRIIGLTRHLKEPGRTVVEFGDSLILGTDRLRQLEAEVVERDWRVRQAVDVDYDAPTLMLGSEDTSRMTTYADFIVPTGASNFQYYLMQAIDALPERGGQVVILEGEYTYNADIVIDKDNVKITGQGTATEIKLAEGVAEGVAGNGFYVINRYNVVLQDFLLDGREVTQSHFQSGVTMEGQLLVPENWGWEDYPVGDEIVGPAPESQYIGWGFTPTTDFVIDKVRLKYGETKNRRVQIWRVYPGQPGEGELLVDETVSAVSGQWTDKEINDPITVEEGNHYAIVVQYTSGDDAHVILEDDMSSNQFDSRVGFTNQRRTPNTSGNHPPDNITDASLAVDFQIAAEGVPGNENFTLRNLNIKNYTLSGIDIYGGKNAEIVNCRASGNDFGVVLWDAEGVNTNLRILGCELNGNVEVGLFASSGEDLLVENNSFVGNETTGAFFVEVNNSTILGNVCRQAASAGIFSLAGMGFLDSDNNTITGNTSNGNEYWGISLHTSSRNIVTSNSCNNSENASGIHLFGDAEGYSNQNTVQNNACRDNAQYGIHVDENCQDNQVTNNDLLGNTIAGLLDEGTGTITDAGNRT